MKSEKRKTGDIAEDLVIKYARGRGWKILARNFQKPWGEIDIIAAEVSRLRRKKTILFIEVKAQTCPVSVDFRPEFHFTADKQQKLIRTAHSYLLQNKYSENTDYRFDLAAVELNQLQKVGHLRYYRNAIDAR